MYSCGISKDSTIKIDKIDSSSFDSINIKFEKSYLRVAPKEWHRKDDEVLVFFSSNEFVIEHIIVNKKDTLIFSRNCGLKPYRVRKKQKNFLIEGSDGTKTRVKLLPNYDYIHIISANKYRNITYFPFFPAIRCM